MLKTIITILLIESAALAFYIPLFRAAALADRR